MPDKPAVAAAGFGNRDKEFRETVCIDVNKVYDSCKDRDCLLDLRVYLTEEGQCLLERAISVKPIDAELLWTFIDVEPLPFNRGFYTVDVRFFVKIKVDLFTGCGRPQRVEGLAAFDKRIILFGSEGSAKIFSSEFKPKSLDHPFSMRTNLPKATVEAVDPVILAARIIEPCDKCHCCGDMDVSAVPQSIGCCFENDLVSAEDARRLVVTLGIFSVIRLIRKVQILIPAFDFCIPDKECCEVSEEDACSLFNKMDFPVDEFFPPQKERGQLNPCGT